MALTKNIPPPGPEVALGSPLSTFVCCGMEAFAYQDKGNDHYYEADQYPGGTHHLYPGFAC